MDVGIACAGNGTATTAPVISASARAAEDAGFTAFWFSEHVVTFDAYLESNHPYPGDPNQPYVEPVVAMAWAAATTSTIELGSNVIILPQRNPLILAKQISSLDALSGGRIAMAVGTGWAKEEFDAIGADWSGRGNRTDEHIEAMRALWSQELASYSGDTVDFRNARMSPKPARAGGVPILIGGESDRALRRVARLGDGWYPLGLPLDAISGRVAKLRQLTTEQGRDPDKLRILWPILPHTPIDVLRRARDAGITEFYLLAHGELPPTGPDLETEIRALGEKFVRAVAEF